MPGNFFLSLLMKVHTEVHYGNRLGNPKYQVSAFIHYQDMEIFLFFGFFNNATLFSNQLFSNFTCLKLRAGRTQNRWNFCNILTRSRVIRERRIFIFNSVLTVYSLFSTFLHLKIYQKSYNKDRTV